MRLRGHRFRPPATRPRRVRAAASAAALAVATIAGVATAPAANAATAPPATDGTVVYNNAYAQVNCTNGVPASVTFSFTYDATHLATSYDVATRADVDTNDGSPRVTQGSDVLSLHAGQSGTRFGTPSTAPNGTSRWVGCSSRSGTTRAATSSAAGSHSTRTATS